MSGEEKKEDRKENCFCRHTYVMYFDGYMTFVVVIIVVCC